MGAKALFIEPTKTEAKEVTVLVSQEVVSSSPPNPIFRHGPGTKYLRNVMEVLPFVPGPALSITYNPPIFLHIEPHPNLACYLLSVFLRRSSMMEMSRDAMWASLIVFTLIVVPATQAGSSIPKSLRGKIITSNWEIEIPTQDFVKQMVQQDQKSFSSDQGSWTIYFVAFFSRPLPSKNIGLVVFDAKGKVTTLAQYKGQPGQLSLASHIVIDATQSPGEQHTLQVFFQKKGKPIVLATKKIILK